MSTLKKINGFSNYLINESGRVMHKDRKKVLKCRADKSGYSVVKVKRDDGKWTYAKVHRLMLYAFWDSEYYHLEIDHIDMVKTNNCLANLEPVTHQENIRRAKELGAYKSTRAIGHSHGRSKLDDMIVLTIRSLPPKAKNGRGAGFSNKDLALNYSVSAKVLTDARKGHTWKHLPSAS